MEIEGIKEVIKCLSITPTIIKTLRESARLKSTHYSTYIEGNRLAEDEVEEIVKNDKSFKGRERDEKEIKGYFIALEYVEKNANKPITEQTIKTIHALVDGGGRNNIKPTPYRDGQNVIRDSSDGRIVYMPPEYKDVPVLMKEFVEYLNSNTNKLPIPVLAGIAHYQFTTIHPYYDGNGRTARLLTNLVLYRGGYDLKGIYSLEEYYANNLQEYYKSISIGEHHNYHFGRAEADITPWIEYFVFGMLSAFKNVRKHAENQIGKNNEDKTKILRTLTPQQRKVLTLFEDTDIITSNDIAKLFNFTQRSARNIANKLVNEGFLEIKNKANRTRSFKLNKK
jgi:Fic family protein